MASNPPPILEHMIRELRDELREVVKLRSAVEALTLAQSDSRDAIVKLTHTLEDLVTAVHKLNKAA